MSGRRLMKAMPTYSVEIIRRRDLRKWELRRQTYRQAIRAGRLHGSKVRVSLILERD